MSAQLDETHPSRPAMNPNEHHSPARETPVDSDIPREDSRTETYGAGAVSKCRQLMTVLAAFTVNFTACGLLFTFGIYQALYESMATQGSGPFIHASSSEIDLIGSLSASVMTMAAPFAVAWAKYFETPRVVWAGAVVFGLANVAASFGTALWHFQLAQGLLLGIGTSLSFVPSMTVTPTWFESRRGLAMGIASAGTGIGGLVWAPVVTACIDNMGFRDTLRLTGAVAAALIGAAGFALDWEPTTRRRLRAESAAISPLRGLFRIPLPAWETVKQRKFIAHALGAAFQSAAYYTPVFYLQCVQRYWQDFNRFHADRMGRVNAFFVSTFLSAIAALGLWLPSAILGTAHEALGKHLYISFTVLYSLFASAYVSLFPAILVELFGVNQLPYTTGILYMAQGMAALVGTPVAGVLIRGSANPKSSDDYTGMTILVGALLVTASASVAWVRCELMLTPTSEKPQKWKV
ncbi:hypothetical protein PV08_05855 [Exophiala spinifera]|uniref:Major facilitator superfamily (MFS) profile domain-containing protein n=1 Tax=Exophiala spinifera TaxID=91928 RepID=A0A0D2BB15_9EURO|nr:uncharacterized protein PV08_05855 [Exophiala spinifera]KIW15805.1 hypothetical protein PV08_05855 [Exophiala spinifera]